MKTITKLQAKFEGKKSQISIGNLKESNKVLIAILSASHALGIETYASEFDKYLQSYHAKAEKKLSKNSNLSLEDLIKAILK